MTRTADRPTARTMDGLPTSSINAFPERDRNRVTACSRQGPKDGSRTAAFCIRGSWNSTSQSSVDGAQHVNGEDKNVMFRSTVMMAVFASLLAIAPAAKAQYGGYGGGPGPGPSPGYGGPGYGDGHAAHCARMRDRLHEVRYRMQYADPWQRERMATRADELRDRLRSECWGR